MDQSDLIYLIWVCRRGEEHRFFRRIWDSHCDLSGWSFQPLKATSSHRTQAVKFSAPSASCLFFTLSIPCLPFLSLFADQLWLSGRVSIPFPSLGSRASAWCGLFEMLSRMYSPAASRRHHFTKQPKAWWRARDANAIRMVINYPHTHIRMYYKW